MPWRTSQEVGQLADELLEMGTTLRKACQKWTSGVTAGTIERPVLFINDLTALAAVRGSVRKVVREVDGKVDDAIAGTYDWRSDVGNGGSKTDG